MVSVTKQKSVVVTEYKNIEKVQSSALKSVVYFDFQTNLLKKVAFSFSLKPNFNT